MKNLIFIILVLFISMAIFGQVTKTTDQDLLNHYPLPIVDKRVELLSIVFRLAGNFEYNEDAYRSYVSDIHNHFDKYKNHPLIVFAKEMSDKNGVGFDAVQAMAIYLKQPPLLDPLAPFSSKIPERRWGQDNAGKFVALLKQFYIDARCDAFFAEHETLYQTAQERIIPVYKALDLNWYYQFYGTVTDGSLNIIAGLGLGGGNYGPKAVLFDGSEAIYAIMGTWLIDSANMPVYPVDQYLLTLIHEFNHSWVNPLTKKYEKEFEDGGKKLFNLMKEGMGNQHYNSWQTMMNESLVRASVIRYLLKHHPDGKAAKDQLISDFGRGFFWIKGLVETLGIYEKNRDRYPTLEHYVPVLVDFYNGVVVKSVSMFEIAE
ncbi:MAG TPA: DUF4932 domain-containing protein [Bacteroidales bacterium]|nr:DUF4932 domain-containing protein [Bacteroidales bacterium]HPS49483.1 DUF4932 domain-containing protein [Bacteroidales bacterium]